MKLISSVLIGLVFSTVLSASELLVSSDIWDAVRKAKALARQVGGPDKVLFVTDLDNTLLKTKQDLGGEPWFLWQNEMLKEQDAGERVACDFSDLLQYTRIAMQLTHVEPVQIDQADAIAELQKAGIGTMALTSRGLDLASATFQQLASAKLDFAKASPARGGLSIEPYLPIDLERPVSSGLDEGDVARLGLTKIQPVLYQRGVFFGEGQHKGAMLKTFLHQTGSKVRAVVFWDNEQRNNNRIVDAFTNTELRVAAFRASRQDEDISRFETADKQRVTKDFLLLRKALDRSFGYGRPCRLPIDSRTQASE